MEIPNDELRIAEELKTCCDQSGKEIDLANSTKAIHKLSLVYRNRSPDKLSLIKCVGLLNAAIARKPLNESQIRSDLAEVCQHILQLSCAEKKSEDLLVKAQNVKALIQEMRTTVKNLLEQPEANPISSTVKKESLTDLEKKKISSIQQINHVTTEQYTSIMANLCEYCQSVMGPLPCEYAVAGMGSLARKEITPYSDFEHILLMEEDESYETKLEYFRWFSVMFHVVVLNLQETIIPSLSILSLNNPQAEGGNWFFDAHTPRGVSFDGMMVHACKFPLGRQEKTQKKPWTTELIKPVSEMLQYLNSEEDLKNGYHLSDILTKTCFVFGNVEVYKQFATGIEKILNEKTNDERIEEVKHLVRDDLDQFSTRFRLARFSSSNSINIKQLMYRSSTLFLAALGRINNISKHSCFDIITEMESKHLISQTTKHKLLYATAIACELRLRVYASNQSQQDIAIDLKQDREKNLEKFLNIVGVRSTINYFQIVYCLQCLLAQQLKFTKLHFYSNPQLMNLAICFAFGFHDSVADWAKYKVNTTWDISKFDFDECLQQIENGIDFDQRSRGKTAELLQMAEVDHFSLLGEHLYSSGFHDEALEMHRQALSLIENRAIENMEVKDRDAAKTYSDIGVCLCRLDQGSEALAYLRKAMTTLESSSSDKENDLDIAINLGRIGVCLNYCFHDFEDSLTYYQRSLEIRLRVFHGQETDPNIARLFGNIGSCLRNLGRYDEALVYLQKSLTIFENLSVDDEADKNIALTLNRMGTCHQGANQSEEALTYHKRSLAIYLKATLDEKRDRHLAMVCNDIGVLLQTQQRYDEAISYLKKSHLIHQNITLDKERDYHIARVLHTIGSCLMDHGQIDEGNEYLQKSIEVYRTIGGDDQKRDAISNAPIEINESSKT